jgi:hypothetical protein
MKIKNLFINKNNKSLVRNKTDRRLETFDVLVKVVKWLTLSLSREDKPNIPLSLLTDLCNKLSTRLKSRGIKDTIKYIKSVRGNFYNYLSGNILRDAGSPCYGEQSFPSILGPLKKYVDDDNYNVIRIILTILTATRSIKIKGEVDTSTITQPVKGDVPDLTQYMPDF